MSLNVNSRYFLPRVIVNRMASGIFSKSVGMTTSEQLCSTAKACNAQYFISVKS